MMMKTRGRAMSVKVGEVARRTGISIRTLHYYDEIGLVSPSQHSDAGHRIYTDQDVQRLQQILVLRSLGFSLEKIREFLTLPSGSPLLDVIEHHMVRMHKEIEDRRRVVTSLETIADRLRSQQNTTIEEILNLMEALEMIDKYYTQEQLEELKIRAGALGEEGMKQAQNDWKELIEEVKIEIDRGTKPEDESVQILAQRWQALIELFTGGTPAIKESMKAMYSQEGASRASSGALDEKTMAYMSKAIEALRSNSG
jgi:DNA-binding transcriptional MerR regulator